MLGPAWDDVADLSDFTEPFRLDDFTNPVKLDGKDASPLLALAALNKVSREAPYRSASPGRHYIHYRPDDNMIDEVTKQRPSAEFRSE